MSDVPKCGFADCDGDAVASRAVRGTVWFAQVSRQSPANGEEAHWELGGYVEPSTVMLAIQVCEVHNAVTEEANVDLG